MAINMTESEAFLQGLIGGMRVDGITAEDLKSDEWKSTFGKADYERIINRRGGFDNLSTEDMEALVKASAYEVREGISLSNGMFSKLGHSGEAFEKFEELAKTHYGDNYTNVVSYGSRLNTIGDDIVKRHLAYNNMAVDNAMEFIAKGQETTTMYGGKSIFAMIKEEKATIDDKRRIFGDVLTDMQDVTKSMGHYVGFDEETMIPLLNEYERAGGDVTALFDKINKETNDIIDAAINKIDQYEVIDTFHDDYADPAIRNLSYFDPDTAANVPKASTIKNVDAYTQAKPRRVGGLTFDQRMAERQEQNAKSMPSPRAMKNMTEQDMADFASETGIVYTDVKQFNKDLKKAWKETRKASKEAAEKGTMYSAEKGFFDNLETIHAGGKKAPLANIKNDLENAEGIAKMKAGAKSGLMDWAMSNPLKTAGLIIGGAMVIRKMREDEDRR